MRRLIVTGANGVGKSHLAARLAGNRPDVPVISFDAIKLTRDWQKRPRLEVEEELLRIIEMDAWILEGGPSLLHHAIKRADGVIWLDPPEWVRALRLFARPWRNIGRTRPELPLGNNDWPFEQYKFAIRSLRKRSKFRNYISTCLDNVDGLRVWHIRSSHDMEMAVDEWRNATG